MEAEEIGRAIYHLGRRRGFKSNRGAKMASLSSVEEVRDLLVADTSDDDSETDKSDGPVLSEMTAAFERSSQEEHWANTSGKAFRRT